MGPCTHKGDLFTTRYIYITRNYGWKVYRDYWRMYESAGVLSSLQ